ncbi:Fic family protein [Nocardia carnea]|uniref:Fic family protein n=1 Tax=Nocardia carnea TaxID=37328 RepID=UPI0024551308|nr:Fic family protein [Nocardia carnea]
MVPEYRRYIWQHADWPAFGYDAARLVGPLAEVAHQQGRLLGRLAETAEAVQDEASLSVLTQDVVKTSEIEGELLDVASVRSSLARHLGVDIGALAPADRHVDGVVEMVLDAAAHHSHPVTADRLFGWHAALFPTGYSGRTRLTIGAWRTDAAGPMQVVSGGYGRERVHFEAPPAARLDAEMREFLDWVNADATESALVKAGLAHLWFVTVHPFDDGNGRIARALGDLWLARADHSSRRFFSLSAQIQRDRAAYYRILERTQKGTLDVTEWLIWFLETLRRAIQHSDETVDKVLQKSRFWRHRQPAQMNDRQVLMLNRMLDGFNGKLTTRKWAIITKCSQDTALRDITELLELGVLERSNSGGRSTSYDLARF